MPGTHCRPGKVTMFRMVIGMYTWECGANSRGTPLDHFIHGARRGHYQRRAVTSPCTVAGRPKIVQGNVTFRFWGTFQ